LFRAVVLSLVVSLACSGPKGPKIPPGPRLVVLIVVDQLPSWVFERDRSRFTGGFARMLRDGGVVPRAELPYANTFTAPGHATIGSGTTPSVHGILGNGWWQRAEGKLVDAEFDPTAPVFAVGPPHAGVLAEADNGSAKRLRVEGISDSLRRATAGKGKSIAIALKGRAATFVAGKGPDLAVWYEPGAGGMTTSRAYAPEAPRWLVELAASSPGSRFFRKSWTPLDANVLATVTKIPDAAPGEGRSEGLGQTFPHDLALSDAPAKAIVHTPFADEIVLDAAYAAIGALQLGQDDIPDLLAISLNAHDHAGHMWGPDSWEVLDLTLRLDAALGKLFATLDDKIGQGRWAAVLTSDHGATPVVERGKPGARRVTSALIRSTVDTALASYGEGPWVAKVASSNVYLTEKATKHAKRAELIAIAATALARLPGIATAGPTEKLAGNCETRSGLDQAICLSIVDGESGELYVVPAEGSLITDYATGTHHDAPFDDNRRVPILVLDPNVKAQQGTGTLLQVAPTVTALLRVPPPPAAKSPALFGLR
jgi:hypothetical protein